ncbi:MAG TPA: hypothetical protein DEG17_05765 [Cyanobacteria bacterium UBA11149]|nr:hypothetical protein [Cyanobacteria bacterium UBA11367]HBE58197.1 hypothetical protein [Cyanobacteria bacterium UBA11366]HBK66892.1 hypothetical protein [Cyanobacteria bacterium UBA11166]HBR73461.1 hypothetical protein [Cyanobacteria bacterium UBA11159]HBS71885.1 hypothetical protein [Cyanobacteria bacterium UBA11153]HBW88385.1 hypothetical protein [Cyanobacteria bacterium UBA11149]HCA95488.1 hypothetical protein [Cyanobacteria bacterium UBA9226]
MLNLTIIQKLLLEKNRFRQFFSPLILYYYHEQPYQEIAKQLAISEENAHKQIKQAQSILQKQLNKYLAGEDDTCLDFCLLSQNKEIYMGEEELSSKQGVICQLNLSIPANSKEEEISYNVTVLCQETLPYHWYSSINLLAWR